MLEVNNIYKSFKLKDKEIIANNNISFSISNNEVVGLLGQNGAGKSTLIKILCGLLIPDKGKISIDNIDLFANSKKLKFDISVVLEGDRNLYHYLTPLQNFEYFGSLNKIKKKDIQEKAKLLLEEFDLTKYSNTSFGNLSRGTKQKISLINTLITDPGFLIMDEPTLGLDFEAKQSVIKLINRIKVNKMVLIASHQVEVLEQICDKVLILKDGQVVAFDNIDNLKKEYDQSKRYKILIEKKINTVEKLDLLKDFISEKIEYDNTIEIYMNDVENISKVISDNEIIEIENLEMNLENIYISYLNKNNMEQY